MSGAQIGGAAIIAEDFGRLVARALDVDPAAVHVELEGETLSAILISGAPLSAEDWLVIEAMGLVLVEPLPFPRRRIDVGLICAAGARRG